VSGTGDASRFKKRSVSLAGHKTSVSLENAFWQELDAAAERRRLPLAALLSEIDRARGPGQNLASAARLFVLEDLKQRL